MCFCARQTLPLFHYARMGGTEGGDASERGPNLFDVSESYLYGERNSSDGRRLAFLSAILPRGR